MRTNLAEDAAVAAVQSAVGWLAEEGSGGSFPRLITRVWSEISE